MLQHLISCLVLVFTNCCLEHRRPTRHHRKGRELSIQRLALHFSQEREVEIRTNLGDLKLAPTPSSRPSWAAISRLKPSMAPLLNQRRSRRALGELEPQVHQDRP